MRLVIFICLFLIFYTKAFSQNELYLDENKKSISREYFFDFMKNNNTLYSQWAYIDSTGTKTYQLKKDLYQKFNLNYKDVKIKIEQLIFNKIKDSATILIKYNYKNDLCTRESAINKWSKEATNRKKKYNTTFLPTFKKNNIHYIVFFEPGILFYQRAKSKREYFFTDNNNFFKKLLFNAPTTCGSFAIIKPNGQTLVRNGEYNAGYMFEHAQPKYWNLFFKAK